MFVLHSIAAKAAKRTTNEAQRRPLSYKYRVKKEQPLLSFIKRLNEGIAKAREIQAQVYRRHNVEMQ